MNMLDKVESTCGWCGIRILKGAAFCVSCGRPVRPKRLASTTTISPLEEQKVSTRQHALITEGEFPGVLLGRTEEPHHNSSTTADPASSPGVAGSSPSQAPAGEDATTLAILEKIDDTSHARANGGASTTVRAAAWTQLPAADVGKTAGDEARSKPSLISRGADHIRNGFRERVVRVEDLSRDTRLLCIAGYAIVLVLLGVILIFELTNQRPGTFTVDTGTALLRVPQPVVLVSLLAFAFGWALVLTGASDCRRRVFVPVLGLFIFQVFLFSTGTNGAGAAVAWWLVLILTAVVATIHGFTRRLRYWRDLPLAEFAAWLIVLAFLAFTASFGSSREMLSQGFFGILTMMLFVSLPFWLILGLEVVDLMVSLGRAVTTSLRRKLTSRGLRRVTALVLALHLASVVVYLAAWRIPSVLEYLPSFASSPLFWSSWRIDSLFAALLVLSLPVIMVARRWTDHVAMTMLTLAVTFVPLSLSMALALIQNRDVVEWGLAALPGIPPVLLFGALITYDTLNFGARFVNSEGDIVPRSGRVLMYLGVVTLVLSVLLFYANARPAGMPTRYEAMQGFIDMMFTVGLVVLGPLYLLWIVWKRQDLLLEHHPGPGEPHRIQPVQQQRIRQPHDLEWVAFIAGAAGATLPFFLFFYYVVQWVYRTSPFFQEISALWMALVLVAAVVAIAAIIGAAIKVVTGALSVRAIAALTGAAAWSGLLGFVVAVGILGYPTGSTTLLIPQRYIFSQFESPILLDVGWGWMMPGPEKSDDFTIMQKHWAPAINFHKLDDVYEPRNPTSILPAPNNMVAWYEGHPHLKVRGKKRVNVGGVSGVQIDAVVSSVPKNYSLRCSDPCVPFFPVSDGGSQSATRGWHWQYIVLEVEGETVIVSVNFSDRDDLRRAQEVLDTIQWAPDP